MFEIKRCTTKNYELFSEIMKLRYEAYAADNRLTWQCSWLDMRDQWDERSIMVAVLSDQNVIGSIRVTINSLTDELSYPAIDISPDQYVESSRLCIHPLYRGRGLWYLLAEQMIFVSHETNRRYIVGSAIDELIPTWEKIGFNRTGYKYFNQDIAGKIHEMLILDIAQVLNGVRL